VGSASAGPALAAATLVFGDGSSLPVGAVLAEPGRPTTLSFMPRTTSSLRLRIERVSGAGPLALSELRAYQVGATPLRSPIPSPANPSLPDAAGCPAPGPAVPAGAGLVVRCPATGSVVDATVTAQVAAEPGYTAVSATVWPADPAQPAGPTVTLNPDPAGTAALTLDLRAAPPGPLTVAFEASGPGRSNTSVYFQLYRRGPAPGGDPAPMAQAIGRTLVYAEEFDASISVSRSGAGADYTAAKPTHDGEQDFGDAIFADPQAGPRTMQVVDGRYLRVGVERNPPGFSDPQGWGRTHLGGLLASARSGGSGFSAQYGYFEARMLAPAAPGTWPAFWLLPNDNLVAPTPAVAEIDAVELYGHEPRGACHSTHEYLNGKDGGVAWCGERFGSHRAALAWHTYGASVTPIEIIFTVDGRKVATAPQVQGGSAPMFFLLDLALGGGWPVQLQAVQDRAALFVDYVRVYV
jgi:hypothetical protein